MLSYSRLTAFVVSSSRGASSQHRLPRSDGLRWSPHAHPSHPAKAWGATGGLQEQLGMVGLEGSGSLLSQENAISFPLRFSDLLEI